MAIWSAEIKELEKLYESFKGQLPGLEKELERLIKADDENMVLLYSRRCLEVIITDLCECELHRPRKTEPLKGIIDKLHKEEKVPSNIITSMDHLNSLSAYGAHPKDFDPEQVKPVLVNLDIIIKWYLKYKDIHIDTTPKLVGREFKSKQSAVAPVEKSIAVLPFLNMSPDKDQDYFCDGITEEIINALAHVENLKVIARTSAFAFKDKQTDIREIGRILDVETLLEGSIRKAGNQLRISAQLIKVSDGSHVWSERYDREMKDVFAIQDEISLAIADNLKVKLLGESKALIARRHPENLDAYNLYLKGTFCWQMSIEEGYKKATEYFQQALNKDPNYVLVYCGWGALYIMRSIWGYVAPNVAYTKAYEFADKALRIDNKLSEAYWMLGYINTFRNWDWKEAERNFKQALEINPNSTLSHIFYSNLLTFIGRNEEAIFEAEYAQLLDPFSAFINTYTGLTYQWAGHPDKGIEELKMALTVSPKYFLAQFNLGVNYRLQGMYEEAVIEYEKAVELSSGYPFAIACLIANYYRVGKIDQAGILFTDLKKRSITEYVPATSFYLVYAQLGEVELALESLKRACEEHDSFLPWLRSNPILIPNGSKYMALVKEMGLDY